MPDQEHITHIDLVVFDGFDELDVVGPLEVLRSAAALGAPLSVRAVSAHGSETATGLFGLSIALDGDLSADADLLIIPGGGYQPPREHGVSAQIAEGLLGNAAGDALRRGAVVAAVCSGTMILANAGLLRGRPAITHWSAADDLAGLGAHVQRARVVDAGDIITCGGVTAGIHLALHLVARLAGEELAIMTARRMEHDWTRAADATQPERA
jgi:transcriptional regulator GlxA family with amidase domain